MKKEIDNKAEAEIDVKSVEVQSVDVVVADNVAVPEEVVITKVGTLLKEMRNQKGYKVIDIAKSLCIRRIYLEAIEDGRYQDIPEDPYGIGFIRSYADYLGMNSSDIIYLYKEEITPLNSGKEAFALEPQNEATMPSKKYLIISLVALVLVYLLWSLYNTTNSDAVVDDSLAETVIASMDVGADLPLVVEDYIAQDEDSVISISVERELPVVSVEPVDMIDDKQVQIKDDVFVEKKVKKDSRVLVKVKKETWIEVRDGSKLYISKVLQPGDEYKVPVGPNMVLSLGKIEGVDVYIDGEITKVATQDKKMGIQLDTFLNKLNH